MGLTWEVKKDSASLVILRKNKQVCLCYLSRSNDVFSVAKTHTKIFIFIISHLTATSSSSKRTKYFVIPSATLSTFRAFQDVWAG